jgi:hypothetical protein
MTQTLLANTSYWSLSQDERNEIRATAPDQDAWDFEVYRLKDGYWAFDRSDLKTYRELLIGNTETVLDTFYSQLSECPPDEYSRMSMTVSRKPLADQTTSCTYVRPCPANPNASFYRDDTLGEEFYLCPWLTQVMYDPAPQKLYVHLSLIS